MQCEWLGERVAAPNLKAVTKPQYVDQIPKAVKGDQRSVGFQMKQRCQVGQERMEEIADVLGMSEFDCYSDLPLTIMQS